MQSPMSRGKKVTTATLIAAALAAPAEGIRQYAYYCPAGILSVCYGATDGVIKGKKYSMEECKAMLDADMQKAVAMVDKCHPGLPVEVLAAFSDAVYNMGPTIACDKDRSTAARYLYQGKLIDACNQLPRWSRAKVMGQMVELPGLVKRREQERQLCLQVSKD